MFADPQTHVGLFVIADGRPVPTDSITLHGSPFCVLLQDAPHNLGHKHLGVRMTVRGDFHAEKVHKREKMNRRIDSLLSDLILTPSIKEYAFKTSVVSVFLHSAGLVPWSLNEPLEINATWSSAYTRFCRVALEVSAWYQCFSYPSY